MIVLVILNLKHHIHKRIKALHFLAGEIVFHKKGKLVNVADMPELCDFYLSSVVKKGNLKIAISTNGKSPTIAKRLKDLFNELLPEEIDELLDNMQSVRNRLKGDFNDKVNQLNAITKDFVLDKEVNKK